MAKLPYFPFFPEDWLSDEKLRACSLAARALWIDMLCLMHKNDRRGYLQLSGKPVTADQLARMTGCSTDEVSRLVAELLNAGVPSVSDNEVIYSRRMTRDEKIRAARSEAGQKGGKKTGSLLRQIVKQKSSKRSSKRQAPDPEPDLYTHAGACVFAADEPPLEKTRQRDELFDALVALTGADPKVNGSHVGRVCKALRAADPPYTPAEVKSLPGAIAAAGLDLTITLGTVEKFIGWVRTPPSRSSGETTGGRKNGSHGQRGNLGRNSRVEPPPGKYANVGKRISSAVSSPEPRADGSASASPLPNGRSDPGCAAR